MFGFLRKNTIEPEALWAYRSRLPDTLKIKVSPDEEGGFNAVVENLPGCFTEGENFEELCRMVNFATFDYLKIPEQYFPYLQNYKPPQNLIEEMKKLGEKIPAASGGGTEFKFVLA